MKRAVFGITFLLTAAIVLAGDWKQEPHGFHDIPWSGSVSEGLAHFPNGTVPPIGNIIHVKHFQVGAIDTDVGLFFNDASGKVRGLWHVLMTFRPSDLPAMRAVFIKKYGAPTGSRVEYGDRLMVWKGKRVVVELGPNSAEHNATALFEVQPTVEAIRKEKGQKQQREREKQEKMKTAQDAF